jgi:hypothetical protein
MFQVFFFMISSKILYKIHFNLSFFLFFPKSAESKPRTTDTQRELFFKNSKLLGLGRQIGPKFYEAFGVFLVKL